MRQKPSSTSKPRCASLLSKKLKCSRKTLFTPRESSKKRQAVFEAITRQVHDFLANPENSTELPGKADAGKRSLNDTLQHLHAKFVATNPEVTISFSSFARKVPKHYKGIRETARRQCLCIKHVNGKLKMQAIRYKMMTQLMWKTSLKFSQMKVSKKELVTSGIGRSNTKSGG